MLSFFGESGYSTPHILNHSSCTLCPKYCCPGNHSCVQTPIIRHGHTHYSCLIDNSRETPLYIWLGIVLGSIGLILAVYFGRVLYHRFNHAENVPRVNRISPTECISDLEMPPTADQDDVRHLAQYL